MPFFSTADFSLLLEEARSGAAGSLGKLLEPFRRVLESKADGLLSAKLTRHVTGAEAVQETLQTALVKIADFRGATEAELSGWLLQILKNLILSLGRRHLQTRKRGNGATLSLEYDGGGEPLRDLLVDDEPTPSTSMSLRERDAILRETLASLKPGYRELIQLRYEAKKSFTEVAAQLGKSPDAVMKSWPRALRAWRRALAERGVTEW